MRLDGVGEDVDGDFPPQDGRVVVMMRTMISTYGREVPPTESLCQRAKVLIPNFRLEVVALRPESPLLIFFLGQNDLNTRRGALEVGWAKHNPPGNAWGPWRALVSFAHQVAPLW